MPCLDWGSWASSLLLLGANGCVRAVHVSALQSGTAGRAGAFRGACIARAAYDGVDRRGRAAGTATGLTDGSGRAEGVLSWRVKVEMWLENAATCQRDTCVARCRASVSYSIFRSIFVCASSYAHILSNLCLERWLAMLAALPTYVLRLSLSSDCATAVYYLVASTRATLGPI